MKAKRIILFVVSFTFIWFTAGGAVMAAGEGGEDWGWLRIFGRWFNLALFVGILIYAMRRPLSAFFSQRRSKIQGEIEKATQVRKEAEAKLAEVEERMKALDSELEEIRRAAQQSAENERRRVLVEAENDAARIVAVAEREIENLKRHASEELRDYAAQLAVELAEKRIRKTMGAEDESRVLDRFFDQLSAGQRG